MNVIQLAKLLLYALGTTVIACLLPFAQQASAATAPYDMAIDFTIQEADMHDRYTFPYSHSQASSLMDEQLTLISEELLIPSTAVIIDAGHGGVDGGAVYGDVMEKDINLAVAKKLYAILVSRGIPAALNRTGDYALSDENSWHRTSSRHLKDLSQRMGLTRQIEHTVFVSIHVNATASTRANGPLVLHQHTGESALLAANIQNEMNECYRTTKQIVAVKSFYLLKYIQSPAVLIELGFISNATDRQRLTNAMDQTKIASSIANGISQYIWIN